MQLIQAFNAQQFDPTQGVPSLPIGRHPVVVETSEVKANKNNDGGYLQLNLRIIDGPQQGTTGAYRLNLYHTSQQTVEIAHRQLSAICHVINVFQVTDSSQLHGIPFIVEVGPQKNDPQYTEVKKVYDINGNEPGKAGAGVTQAQPQQNAGFGQQQPQQQPHPGAGFGGQQPQGQPAQGGAWGGQQPAQQPQQQPAQQPGAAWGQQPQQQPQQPQGGTAWGGGQPAQNPAPQQAAGGWQQGQQPQGGGAPAGGAPWGAR